MRLLFILAAPLAFSACGDIETYEEEGVISNESVVGVGEGGDAIGPPADRQDMGITAGDYTATRGDQTLYTQQIRADNSYTRTMADGTMQEGNWSWQADGSQLCFEQAGDETCYVRSARADGGYDLTDEQGETITITASQPQGAGNQNMMSEG